MRRHLIVLALVAIPAVAIAGPPKPKPIDVKPMISKLMVFRDEVGQYYVVPTPGQWDDSDKSEEFLFFGDGTSMWQQAVIGSGFTGSSGSSGPEFEWSVWSPRVRNMNMANITAKVGELELQCAADHKGDRKLAPLRADEARLFFAKATFYPPLWTRQTQFLARDDDGTYYFVDRLRDNFGGKDFHVYVGQKGQMKELPMINVVEDSGGDIFATKGGQLKIIASANNQAFWIKGGKKTELTVLEPGDNRYLIYRELGVYQRIGTVCEDM